METLIEAPFILVDDEMNILRDGHILIDDQTIAEVGSGKPPQSDKKIRFEESIIIPGLVNAHVHLGDSAFKDAGFGKTLNDLFSPPNGLKHKLLETTERKVVLEALKDSLLDMLSSGTTTFADFREGAAEGAGILLEALQGKRIRAFVLGRGDYAFPMDQLESNIGTFPQNSLEALKELFAITQGLGPSSPNDLTDEALRQLAEIARAHGKLRAIHAAEHPDSERISKNRSGLTEVERAIKYFHADILVHLTYASPKDLDLSATYDTAVVSCPRANATLGLRLPPIPEMLDRGIAVGLGTDNVMLNSPNMFEEMGFTLKAYRIEKIASRYLSPKEVLQMATINGARALGIDNETGSIREGKSTDLVILDLTARNLRYATDLITAVTHRVHVDNVSLVMAKGEIAYQHHMGSGSRTSC